MASVQQRRIYNSNVSPSNKTSSELKKRLTKTLSTTETSKVTDVVKKFERSNTTLGVEKSHDKSFPSIATAACYQRQDSTLSTISLPATARSKSRIPIPTASRENLTSASGRSTPSNLTTMSRQKFGSLYSCSSIALSNSSLADSLASTGSRIPRRIVSDKKELNASRDDISGRSTPFGSKIPVWKQSQEKISFEEKKRVFQNSRAASDLEVRKKPVVPPKPTDSHLRNIEICAKSKQLTATFKALQKKNLEKSQQRALQSSHEILNKQGDKISEALITHKSLEKQKSVELSRTSDSDSLTKELLETKLRLEAENEILSKKIEKLSSNEAAVREQLEEAKDHAELLEFRLLEVEQVAKSRDRQCQDASVETEDLDVWSDSGCGGSSVASNEEIFKVYQDFRNEKVNDTKHRLTHLMSNISSANDKSLLLQTVALFETLIAKIKNLQDENSQIKSDYEKLETDRDNLVLELESAKNKLDSATEQVSSLQHERAPHSFRDESDILQELHLKTLQEMDEKKSLPSKYDRRSSTDTNDGVYTNKEGSPSSGVASDLSDTEIDVVEFIEKKTVDEKSTQTFSDEKIVEKLKNKLSATKSLQIRNDFDRCEAELEDLRSECNDLVVRKMTIESEIEEYKKQIETFKGKMDSEKTSVSTFETKIDELQKLENFLRKELSEMETKYEALHRENLVLKEEKCELEEAENDSRLDAQRWEHQLESAVEKNEYLADELSSERQSNSILRKKIESTAMKLEEVSNQNNYLESLVLRYEQRVFELEELEVELKEKLILLEECLKIAEWWGNLIMSSGFKLPRRGMITLVYGSEASGGFSHVATIQNEKRLEVFDNESKFQSLQLESKLSEVVEREIPTRWEEENSNDRVGVTRAAEPESLPLVNSDIVSSKKANDPREHRLQIVVKGGKNRNDDPELIDDVYEASVSDLGRSHVSTPAVDHQECDHESDCEGSTKKFGLVRYRSLRDHNGRYYLVVKIR